MGKRPREPESSLVLALMYHDVAATGRLDETGFRGPGADHYKLTPESFADHLDVIGASGRHPELVTTPAETTRRILLTFDDGGRSAGDTIAPMLTARGWRGHFFVTTDRIDTAGFLTRAEIAALHSAGHVVGSHSHSHPVMTRLSDAEIADEWRRSKTILEDTLGAAVTTLSVPTGYYEERVGRIAVGLGYRHVFTSEPWLEPRRLGDGVAYGRFQVTAGTPAARVDALCRFSRSAVWRAASARRAKAGAKTMLGPAYGAVRRALLARTAR